MREALTVAGADTPPPLVDWERRKLLFFAGHIPKLYVRKLRFQVWNALRSHAQVTCVSRFVQC